MTGPGVRVKLTGVACVAHRDELLLAEQGQRPLLCPGQAHARAPNILRVTPTPQTQL